MDSNLPGSGEPEYLGDGPADAPADGADAAQGEGAVVGGDEQPKPRGRRNLVLAGTGIAVLAVVGAGGWAVAQFLGNGGSAAEALPANTAAYVAVDLDPSAAQKIDAIRTMKKFPGLSEKLDLSATDDLRSYFFDKLNTDCDAVSYEKDVKPWIGDKLAVGVVPDGETPVPVVALQTSDEEAARATIAKLDKCDDSDEDPGIAFRNGYLLGSDTQEHADLVARDVDAGTLADDETYQSWMDKVGDPGVVTGYAAKSSLALVKDAIKDSPVFMGGASSDLIDKSFAADAKRFTGMAMAVRFQGGGLEVDVVSDAVEGATSAPSVTDLPDSTAVVLTAALPDGVRDAFNDGFEEGVRKSLGGDADQVMGQFEAQTGLKLPEDIATLLGNGFTLAVDGGVDFENGDPTQIPAMIRLSGDEAKITEVIDKLKALAGPDGDIVQVRKGDGSVLVGLDSAYLDEVESDGDLGSSKEFQAAVPHADGAVGVVYVNFDANDVATRLADLVAPGDAAVKDNLEPLQALGMSSWVEGDVAHVAVRLTTD